MSSDILFNFTQMIKDSGSGYGAQVLEEMTSAKPFFALDSGIRADDIWSRVEAVKECIELIDDADAKRIVSQMMYFSAGIMPDLDSVENRYEYVENLEETINSFRDSGDEFSEKLVAIGPCGIDHDWDSVEFEGREHDYFDHNTVSDEKDLFALQMTLGKKLNMPVIVHSRKGFQETADVLKAVKWNRGVIHGYSYSKSELDFFLDLGWYISFSGTVTYAGKKNFSDMSDLVNYVPKDRLLIETDCPYMTPVPFRGKRNDSGYIPYTAEKLAQIRGVDPQKILDITCRNAKELFNI